MKNILIGGAAFVVILGGILYLLGRDGTNALPKEQQVTALSGAEEGTSTPSGLNAPAPSPSPTTSSPSSPSPAQVSDVKIAYTDNGFAPASITIKKGTKIIFENRANRDVWPASALHPTHTVYPEKSPSDCLGSSFDACHNVKPSESWSFVFNAVGTWRYHDHLSAGKTGEIIVTE